jgi:probable rRNA maturation factor
MKISLLNLHKYRLPPRKAFERIGILVDRTIGLLPGQVNLVFCDDQTIHRLNRDYRGKDKVTDVLTFTYGNDPETSTDRDLAGEIILCIPQTRRQAKEFSLSFESELYKLVIHGFLHLRGYDHEKDDEYRVMKLLEEKIMKSFIESKKN